MPAFGPSLTLATVAERLAGFLLIHKNGSEDIARVATADFLQKNANGTYNALGGATETTSLANVAARAAFTIQPFNGSAWGMAFGSFTGQIQYLQGVDLTGSTARDIALNPFGGNILIGATATLNGGRFFLNFSGSAGAVLQTDSAATQFQMQFYISGTRVGTISTSGSSTAYNTSSDYRLKDIDGPITNSGAFIDALNPVQGHWKADGSRFIGFIAHEVQEVAETPIATGEKDGDEMQGMSYSAPEMIAQMVAELKSLRARVAQLEAR